MCNSCETKHCHSSDKFCLFFQFIVMNITILNQNRRNSTYQSPNIVVFRMDPVLFPSMMSLPRIPMFVDINAVELQPGSVIAENGVEAAFVELYSRRSSSDIFVNKIVAWFHVMNIVLLIFDSLRVRVGTFTICEVITQLLGRPSDKLDTWIQRRRRGYMRR